MGKTTDSVHNYWTDEDGRRYKVICYGSRNVSGGEIPDDELRRRKAQLRRENFCDFKPSPDFIRETELGGNDVVVGTRGLASGFSPGHFIVIDPCPELDKMNSYLLRVALALADYVLTHPEKTFLLTKFFCGMTGITPEVVAPYFAGLLLHGNVRMPADFIDVLAEWPSHFRKMGINISREQNDALYRWRNSRKAWRISRQYGDIFSVLAEDRIGEVSRMLCAADDGEYANVEFINTIRCTIQDLFSAMHDGGYILTPSTELTNCGKELSMMLEVPDHIRSFTFSLVGIVNPASHPTYYRRVIGQGEYKNLLKSLSYMLVSLIEWWASGFPMLEDEDIRRPRPRFKSAGIRGS